MADNHLRFLFHVSLLLKKTTIKYFSNLDILFCNLLINKEQPWRFLVQAQLRIQCHTKF